ncbi:MAG: hypothetical protein Tsb0033_07670 [Winogradskyella sp.]
MIKLHLVKIKPFILTLILLLAGQSCSDDDNNSNNNQQNNIVNVALENNLNTFALALELTDLQSTLEDSGPFTVFAPSDDAFTEFLIASNIDITNMNASQIVFLRNILLNHVVADNILSSTDIAALGMGYLKTEADGVGGNDINLYYELDNSVVRLNDESSVLESDIYASNGIIHIISDVIPLPTIMTFIKADSNLSSLNDALTQDGQEQLLETLTIPNLLSPSPFTLFAPQNSAFLDFVNSNPEINSIDDIDDETLRSVLQHHVIVESNLRASELSNGATIETLEGDSIIVSSIGNDNNQTSLEDGAGNTDIDILQVNIQADNGVIHIIESILIPNIE